MEQYAEMKKAVHVGTEKDMQFIKIPLKENDKWVGKRVGELGLPEQVIMAMIKRGDHSMIPRGDVILQEDSIIILVKRKGKVRIPNGNMVLQEWDRVFMYTDQYVVDGTDIEV